MASPSSNNDALGDKLSQSVDENVWIEVIQQMDAIYVDLVQHQVQLEEKNGVLEQTYRELQQTHEELKTAQRQLIQSEKMASLGRLVAGVAHELNNPISFILGNIHALSRYNERLQKFFTALDTLADPRIDSLRKEARVDRILKDLNPLVEGTNEGAKRVSDIVEALLHFTQPQQREAGEFDLSHVVRTSAQWVLRASQTQPEIVFELPATCVFFGYEGPVHQILVNLINNAVGACERVDQPKLWITLTEQDEKMVISIRDNGTGIDETHLGQIFDPFFTTKHAGKGTGLGLYISYLLASEQCCGDLRAENHRSGGAVFHLTLPIRHEETEHVG